MDDKKIYFASDFHLGVPTYEASRVREARIVRWLEHIRTDIFGLSIKRWFPKVWFPKVMCVY